MDASQSKCRIFVTLLSHWIFILLILGSEITESDHQGDNPFGVKQGQGQILKFMSHTSGGRGYRRSGLPVRPVVPIIHFLDTEVLKFTRARFGFTIIYRVYSFRKRVSWLVETVHSLLLLTNHVAGILKLTEMNY